MRSNKMTAFEPSFRSIYLLEMIAKMLKTMKGMKRASK